MSLDVAIIVGLFALTNLGAAGVPAARSGGQETATRLEAAPTQDEQVPTFSSEDLEEPAVAVAPPVETYEERVARIGAEMFHREATGEAYRTYSSAFFKSGKREAGRLTLRTLRRRPEVKAASLENNGASFRVEFRDGHVSWIQVWRLGQRDPF